MVLCLVAVAQAATGNIDAVDKWAWGTNVGWINFRPTHGGVTVYDDHLEGYAWGENIGWIRLGTHTDLANGRFDGYAWGENVGWIHFKGPGYNVAVSIPVGGIAVAVDKLGLLVPWLGLMALAGLAALGVVVLRRRKP
jgi:hypothetical protein